MTKRFFAYFTGMLFLAVSPVLTAEMETLFPDCKEVIALLNSGENLKACMAADRFLEYCANDATLILDRSGDLQSLAEAFTMKGEWAETEKIYLMVLSLQKKNAASPVEMADTFMCLEFLMAMNANYEKALDYAQQAQDLALTVYPADSPEMIPYYELLSSFYRELKRFPEAEKVETQILAISEKTFGAESLETFNALNRRVHTLLDEKKYEEAEPLILRAVRGGETLVGEDHIAMGFFYDTLARVYDGEGRYAMGKINFEKAIPLYETYLGKENPTTISAVQAFEDLKKKEEVSGGDQPGMMLYNRW